MTYDDRRHHERVLAALEDWDRQMEEIGTGLVRMREALDIMERRRDRGDNPDA